MDKEQKRYQIFVLDIKLLITFHYYKNILISINLVSVTISSRNLLYPNDSFYYNSLKPTIEFLIFIISEGLLFLRHIFRTYFLYFLELICVELLFRSDSCGYFILFWNRLFNKFITQQIQSFYNKETRACEFRIWFKS